MVELFPRFTQESRLLRLHTPLGPDKLLVECLRGEEQVSACFSFQVSVLSTDAHIELKLLLGQPVLVELLTAIPEMIWRPFHGHVTSVECVGANGGFARYRITIEPWCAFLKPGRDSRMFQDKSVFDILDAVFGSLRPTGMLAVDWRYDLADRGIYPLRSLTCQYQESDFDFAERLIYDEGLFYYFEHASSTDNPDFGKHTLVIADHNGAFKPNQQHEIRFTQPGAVMREDSMDRWRTTARAVVESTSMCSWDYRSNSTRLVSASASTANDINGSTSFDTPGAYAYQTRAQGQRIANNQLQALQMVKETHVGAGTVRTLGAGTTFVLRDHACLDMLPTDDARTFAITRVIHLAHNNLSAELRSAIAQALGEDATSRLADEPRDGLNASATIADRALYRNRIDAIRSDVPYRSSHVQGRGLALHPRPTVTGQQTAIVVGPPGSVIHTDRENRIKVQFHWQRNAGRSDQSHSRLDHPSPAGQTGAPADDRSGTWLRVATPLGAIAGANWGAVTVPRVGSEVLIDFLEGDIDRPVVIGSLYNGRGELDAQHNRYSNGTGASTGNAPSWFPGASGAHAHAAVLSGIKSQSMATSQSGNGAYNQLVFDDSAGQARVVLQNHATEHVGSAELNLGALRHQTDNQRLAPTGSGAELKTAKSAALRAGQGLLLSADARAGAAGSQLDSREALAQIEQSNELQGRLARTAGKHKAVLEGGPADPAALPAVRAMKNVAGVLQGAGSGGPRSSTASGQSGFDAYSEPHLQLSSPAGIVASTPSDAVFVAGMTTSLSAGQDVNFIAQGNSVHAVKAGISLFTYGKATAKDKPNQETGMKLHAASGKFSTQSQSGPSRFTADKTITVASVNQQVTVAAAKHVLLTAQGACLKLEGGNIMLHAPGKVDFKASKKELAGPTDGSVSMPALPRAKDIYNEAFVIIDDETKRPMAHVRYRLESASGLKLEGVTDAQGRTQRIFTPKSEKLSLHFPDDE